MQPPLNHCFLHIIKQSHKNNDTPQCAHYFAVSLTFFHAHVSSATALVHFYNQYYKFRSNLHTTTTDPFMFSSVYNTSYHLAHLCKYIFHNLYYSHTLTNSHIHKKQSLSYRSLDFSLWGWRRHNENTKIRNWMVEKSSKYDFKVIIKRIFKLFLFIPLYTYKRERRDTKVTGRRGKKR